MKDKSTHFPLISIVVPVFNAEKTISKLLDSLLFSQSEHSFPLEIILVDDNSTDNTKEIIQSYSLVENIKIISLPVNQGSAFARNSGIEIARGEYIFFIDSDDCISKDFFILFEKNFDPNVDCFLFDMIWIFPKHEIVYSFTKNVNDKRNLVRLGTVCNKIFRKSTLPIFDIDLRYYEDTVFIYKYIGMNTTTINIKHVSDIYYVYDKRNEGTKSKLFVTENYIQAKDRIFSIAKKGDNETKMICLETFIGIIFRTNYPILIKLGIAGQAIKEFFTVLPQVIKNPSKNNLSSYRR